MNHEYRVLLTRNQKRFSQNGNVKVYKIEFHGEMGNFPGKWGKYFNLSKKSLIVIVTIEDYNLLKFYDLTMIITEDYNLIDCLIAIIKFELLKLIRIII